MVRTTILLGYSSFVDWRPLEFVKPLPGSMYCSLCGVVSGSMSLLECFHAFCKKCYKQLTEMDTPRCPLDNADIKPESTHTFSTLDNVLSKRSVRCLNACNGCSFVGPLVELEHHFKEQCSFHRLPCPHCKEQVLHNEMWSHVQKTCLFVEAESHHAQPREVPGPSNGTHNEDALRSALEHSTNRILESVNRCTEALKNSGEMVASLITKSEESSRVVADTNDTLSSLFEDRVRCEEFDVWSLAFPDLLSDRFSMKSGSRRNVFVFDNIKQKQANAVSSSNSLCFVARTPFGQILVNDYRVHMRQVCNARDDFCSFEFNILFEGPTENAPPLPPVKLTMTSQRNADLLTWQFQTGTIRPNKWVAYRPKRKLFAYPFLVNQHYVVNNKIVFVLDT